MWGVFHADPLPQFEHSPICSDLSSAILIPPFLQIDYVGILAVSEWFPPGLQFDNVPREFLSFQDPDIIFFLLKPIRKNDSEKEDKQNDLNHVKDFQIGSPPFFVFVFH